MDKETLTKYVKENPELISLKHYDMYGSRLMLLKYKNKVFWKNLWTPELMECRGLIVDSDWNIVQRPFTKVFNYGEKNAPIFKDSDRVITVRKINGFMAAVTVHNGELLVSTTGSLYSEFVHLAKKWISHELERKIKNLSNIENYTLIFEIVDVENDPHIIKERVSGPYLIGIRKKDWDSVPVHPWNVQAMAESLGCYSPQMFRHLKFGQALEMVKGVYHEGFMLYDPNNLNKAVKLKSPTYLMTKLFGRMKDEKLAQFLSNINQKKKSLIDEEYYPLLDHIKENNESFTLLDTNGRIEFIRNFLEDTYRGKS